MNHSPEEQRRLDAVPEHGDAGDVTYADADAARVAACVATTPAVPVLPPRCVLCRQPGGVLVEGRDGIKWHAECARDV